MGSIYVICSRQCPNGDGIYTLLNALYKYSTSITNQPTNSCIITKYNIQDKTVPSDISMPSEFYHVLIIS